MASGQALPPGPVRIGPEIPARRNVAAVLSWAGGLVGRPITNPVALAGLVIVWTGLAWLRLDPTARGTIWAEDGRDFLADASRLGGIRALFIPYAGYMHIMPRIVAAITVLFPVEYWAQIVTGLCCGLAALVALAVYLATGGLPVRPWGRLALASITVLAPTLVAEVLGEAANLYHFALWLGLWMFLLRPRRWSTAFVAAVPVLLATTTVTQIIVLAPLLLFRRSRTTLPMLGALIVGLVVQAYAFTHSERVSRPSFPWPGTVLDGYFHQVAIGAWIESSNWGATLIVVLGWVASVVALAPFVIAFVVQWRRPVERSYARLLAVVTLGGSLFFWTISFALNNLAIDYSIASPASLVASSTTLRYAVLPCMLLWALLVLALSWRRESTEPRRIERFAVCAGIAALVIAAAVNFAGLGVTIRAHGPAWEQSLAAARSTCVGMGPRATVDLPIAPVGAPWLISLRCEVVNESVAG